MKVLISDPLHHSGVDILRGETDICVVEPTGLSEDELLKIIGEYNALIVRSGTKVTRKLIEAGVNLKVIGRAGIGVDNIDVGAATEHGIIVMNTPAGNTITTAEHTLSMLLSLARHIPQAYGCLQECRWERKCFMGVELYGKTLGIIGLGRIGREITKRVQALGMSVIAYDPYLRVEDAKTLNVEALSLAKLYEKADFITIHTPLTQKTKHLIDKEAISQMKEGVYLINCARGGIIDEKALYDALVSGQAAGAALDVFEQEPPKDSPLLGLFNVICTPHLGASTKEAQEKVAVEMAHQMLNLIKNGTIASAINTPSLSQEALAQIKPYIKLGQALGKLGGQLYSSGISKLRIKYTGTPFIKYSQPISNIILEEFLKGIQNKSVNQVNAAIIAKKQGIDIEEEYLEQTADYTQIINLEFCVDKKVHRLAGTLFNNKIPRIIGIDQFEVEIIPQGYILLFFNQDRPKIIGEIGTILGDNQINIADMQFGRQEPGGDSISVFRIDSQAPDSVLSQLAQLPNLSWVKQVYL